MASAPSSPADIDARTRILLEGPLLRILLKLAVPNAVVMVTQISVPLAEMYFIAGLSVDALAGVSEVFPVLSLVGALSQGAVGGGVVSALARTLGRGRRTEASTLVWYAVAIAILLGLITTAIILGLGPIFYRAMGAHDLSLDAAVTYSNLIFSGAVLIWLFNLLLAVIRGTGNLFVPVIVVCGGALVLLPLLPVLILGFGPIPGFGVIGGAIGILIYYVAGCLTLVAYLWGHRGVLRPPTRPPALQFRPIWEILRVGGMSGLVSATTNITLAIITGFVGTYGVEALAGYGAASRLEFMLVPLSYGIGGPAGILIGTNIGAGDTGRALRAAWMGTSIAVLTAETIGLLAACWPMVWLGAFSRDPAVLATGSAYLRTVGPFFGFFGMGYALYCAGQGTGRMAWPAAGAVVRAGIAILGGALALRVNGSLDGIFLAAGLGMATFGCLSLPGLILRIGYGGKRRPPAGHPASLFGRKALRKRFSH